MPENLEKIQIEKVPQTESPPQTEAGKEKVGFSEDKLDEVEKKQVDKIVEKVKPSSSTQSSPMVSDEEKERIKKIDKILSAGLEETYLSLTPELQKEFKLKGEETSSKINQLLSKAKINLSKIVKLIKKWLLLIPKINPFFLEQEAKIKADKIINLKNKEQ